LLRESGSWPRPQPACEQPPSPPTGSR
jgi:hypothetical protein